MVEIPTKPTITCGFGWAPVAVVATYAGGLVPISDAKVRITAEFYGIFGPGGDIYYTDFAGIAQGCYVLSVLGLGVFIQKDGIDFGEGAGVEHFIGKTGIRTGPYMLPKVVARTSFKPPEPPKLPCSGFMSVSLPNFSEFLSGPKLPGSIPFTLRISGNELPENIPLTILVDGRRVTTASGQANSSVNIDLLAFIRSMGVSELNRGHTVVIRSNLPDCYIPQTAFDIPPLIPVAPPCSGLLSIVHPTFPSLLSGPTLPQTIPVPVSITGNGLPQSIPLSILVDGNKVSTATGIRNGSVNIDVLAIIGASFRSKGHTVEIRPDLPDCNIPAASFSVPALIPSGIEQACTEGETKTFRCPDGSEIVIARCKKDPITGLNVFVPTGEKCPISLPTLQEIGKIVKILTYPAGAALEAYDGMEVTVTASVACGASLSNGETAIFSVDGNEVSRGTTGGGFVTFKWTATVEPSRTHKLCVSVPKSSQCSQFGEARDCKTITVSRAVPNTLEQLKKERESYLAQLEGQRVERERIRQISLTLPQTPTILPEVTVPVIPDVPKTPSIPVSPPEEQIPGIIDIPTVSIPPGVPYPVEIRIDGNLVGPPPVYKEVVPGTHTVTIGLKGFTPISRKVHLSPGQILTIDERFA